MNKSQTELDEVSDEIDLLELFSVLWAGKLIIVSFVLVTVMLGSLYLHRADRQYSVSLVVAQTGDKQSGPNLSGLGGLASLAGVSLPSGGTGDFSKFKALLRSEELSNFLIENVEISKRVFKSEWNSEAGRFERPTQGQLSELSSQLKFILTGDVKAEYRAPDAARLADFLVRSVSLSDEKDTGFLKLSMEVVDSSFAVELLQDLVLQADKMLKEQYVETGEQALMFYQEKLSRARSQEHREALAKMIASEEQQQMLASRDGPFVAEVVMGPSVSLQPTSPKSSLVLAMCIVLGGFFGAAYVLVSNAIRKWGNADA